MASHAGDMATHGSDGVRRTAARNSRLHGGRTLAGVAQQRGGYYNGESSDRRGGCWSRQRDGVMPTSASICTDVRTNLSS